MKELGAKPLDERFNTFARGEPAGGENFVCGGIFFNSDEKFLNNLARFVHKLARGESENQNLFEVFKRFLESKDYLVEGRAIYPKDQVNLWKRSYEVYKDSRETGSFYRKNKDDRIRVHALVRCEPSELEDRSGIVILRVEGYEDREISKELEWELREIVLHEWFSLSEDLWVKNYLSEVKETMEDIKCVVGKYYEYPFDKLVFYLLPISFDRFFNAIIISRASLFYRREETEKKLWSEMRRYVREFEVYYRENNKNKSIRSIEDIKNLFHKALEKENLKVLREDWKKFLKKVLRGESRKIRGVFLGKEEADREVWFSFGEYLIPKKNIRLYIYHEEGTEDMVREFKKYLQKIPIPYTKDIRVSFDERSRPIHYLFGGKRFFECIKGKERSSLELKNKDPALKNKEAQELLYALLQFTVRLHEMQNKAVQLNERGYFVGNLLVLNTDLENDDRYKFWEYVRFIYDYYGLPVQTVTRRTIESLRGSDGKAVLKNMMISLYKDSKVLSFDFEGFDLPEELTIYVFLEKPSPRLFYRKRDTGAESYKHYLYEVYKISIKDKRAYVELDSKFLVMANGAYGDEERLREYVKKIKQQSNVRLFFITAERNSFINDLYEEFAEDPDFREKVVSVRYMEIKTAYMSSRVERDCLVIYSDDFERALQEIGIKLEEDRGVVAIKPSTPPKDEYKDFHHPALQVFFVDKVGVLRDEVYARKKNIFFFTLMALSMFESEAALVPFSKLNVWSTRKGVELVLKRNNLSYRFNLWTVIFEMLEFMRHIPVEWKETDVSAAEPEGGHDKPGI